MEFEKVLLSRKSCRSYADKTVEADKLNKVVAAASLAPVGLPMDGKPVLTVVTDKDMLSVLGHQSGGEKDMIYGASALIIVSCPSTVPGIAEMNAACAVEMMSLMATDLGLGSIYLFGAAAMLAKNAELKKKLDIDDEHAPLAALALGYGSEPVSVCKELKETLASHRV